MTLREIYQALIDGKKLCCADMCYRYLHIKDGELRYDDGSPAHIILTLGKWSIYEEPEDLKDKIENKTKELEYHAFNGMHRCLSQDVLDLIDLKIKQAKL